MAARWTAQLLRRFGGPGLLHRGRGAVAACVWALSLAAACAQSPLPAPVDGAAPAARPAAAAVPAQPVAPSGYFVGAATSLESRVADLEQQLREQRLVSESLSRELSAAQGGGEQAADEGTEIPIDTKPVIKPRGRLHTDINWFDQSPLNRETVGDIQDGVYFRRARLGFDAAFFEVTEWRLDFEMGSAGGRPSVFDAYGRIKELPILDTVTIGHMREPFSLEALTSSNWFTFIERALNNTFDPSRNWGVMFNSYNASETLTWAAGVFREGSDNFGDDIGDSGEWAATGRMTWLPYYDEPTNGRYFWEVGGSYSYRDPDNRFLTGPGDSEESIVRYLGRPADNLNEDGIGSVPPFVAVAITDAIDLHHFGVETSTNLGSLNLQSEFIGASVNRASGESLYYHGAYVQASYFLTGESRRWNRKNGFFERAEVHEPFFRVRTPAGIASGWGAWELVTRWNYLDLSDGDVRPRPGYMDVATAGVNWYLSPYMRMMFNYEYADLHDPTDGQSNCNVYHARLDVHF